MPILPAPVFPQGRRLSSLRRTAFRLTPDRLAVSLSHFSGGAVAQVAEGHCIHQVCTNMDLTKMKGLWKWTRGSSNGNARACGRECENVDGEEAVLYFEVLFVLVGVEG